MSLLIKALDKAMTDKATTDKTAVQNKQSEKLPLELSLESITPTEAESIPEISLEEEAGLDIAPSKYAKPKTVANAKTAKTTQLEKTSTAQDSSQKNQRVPINNPLNLSKPTFPESTQSSADIVSTQLPPVFQAMASQAENVNQKAAAKVFVANQQAKTASSKRALALLGLAGALIIWLGIQGYGYVKTLMMPDVVVVKPAVVVTPQDVNAINLQAPIAGTEQTDIEQSLAVTEESLAPEAELEIPSNSNIETLKQAKLKQADSVNNTEVIESDDSTEIAQSNIRPNSRLNKNQESGQKAPKNDSSLLITSKTQANEVDPNLSAAYAAFNRGDNALAQQKYRQVLQSDVRNTDALLGMAAIAQRQGRDADAVGWYQKVLEIEPRNSMAQSALVNAQINTDSTGRESRIKSMIAQQPEAHLYAALGNEYAEQNQWSSAQDAYFNASRLSPNNADYAFNLAISLEQLGKSNLALAQYERTLDLLNKSGANSPNLAVLEARIQALQ